MASDEMLENLGIDDLALGANDLYRRLWGGTSLDMDASLEDELGALAAEEASEDIEDDYLEGFDDALEEAVGDKKPKRKTKKKSNNEQKRSAVSDDFREEYGECEWAKLEDIDVQFNVHFKEHIIPYKEQEWKIPGRDVEYHINLVKHVGKSLNIAESIYGNMSSVQNNVRLGNSRFYSIQTFENVKGNLTTIGYVEVINNGGKPQLCVKLAKKALEESYADVDKVRSQVLKRVMKLVHTKKQTR